MVRPAPRPPAPVLESARPITPSGIPASTQLTGKRTLQNRSTSGSQTPFSKRLTLIRVCVLAFCALLAVALFGFTLSYDEFPRSWLTVGSLNTLPIEIWTMTTNVTSPALYALGTVTSAISFVAIGLAIGSIAYIQHRRSKRT